MKPRARTLVVALAALVALGTLLPGCGNGSLGAAAGTAFEPATPGVLTVASAFLPSPGFWEGPPEKPAGGFEGDLAVALATQLGLDRVKVVHVDFSALVDGDLGGADLALSQITPTRERSTHLDFTSDYLTAAPGVLVRKGVAAEDLAGLQELRWVVVRSSTLTRTVRTIVRPDADPLVVADRGTGLRALREGRADAILLDLPVAQGLATTAPDRYEVIGQLPGTEGLAAALPNRSPNLEITDSAIRTLQADGTIDRLEQRWLGGTPDDIPLIRTKR